MARELLTIGGAVVGSFFGYPQLGYAIGSIIGNIVDPQKIRAPGLKELPVMGVTEGAFRQVAYGTTVLRECQLIDWGDLDVVEVEERQGKGGPVVVSERLYQTYAVGLGEPVEAIRYIKRNGIMVYDVRPGSTILAESAEFAERFRFYPGSETQLPDPDLEALPRNGIGNTPHYRGTSYFVMVRDDLTDLGGRIPTYEVEVQRIAGLTSSDVTMVTNQAYYSGSPSDLQLESSIGWAVTIERVAVSPSGIYAVGSTFQATGADRFQFKKYDAMTESWSALSAPGGVMTQGPRGMVWHPSSEYFVALTINNSGSQDWRVYWVNNDSLSIRSEPAVYMNTTAETAAWSDDGTRLVLSNGNSGQVLGLYDFDVTTGALSNLVEMGDLRGGLDAARQIAFQPGASPRYMAVCADAHIHIVDIEQNPPVAVVTESTGPIVSALWNAAGSHLIIVEGGGAPYDLGLWEFDSTPGSEALTFVSNAAVPADGLPVGVAQTPSRGHIGLVRLSAGPVYPPEIYSISAAATPVLTRLTDPDDTGAILFSLSWAGAPLIPQYGASSVTLAAIVSDICDRCGIPLAKLDLSELTDEVRGTTLGGAYDGAGAITTLMPAFLFDLFEADRQLFAPKRGGAVKATITADDLLEDIDENTLRGQGIEYPRALQLKYLNPGQDYAAPAATVTNKTVSARVRGEVNVDLPIAFNETEALNVAARMLKIMWEDVNGEATLSLPSGPFAWLTPTDCLGLVLRGATYRVRVEKHQQTGGRLQLTVCRDLQSAYTSNLTAIPLPAPNPPPPSLAGATTFVAMNLPGRVDADDQLGFVFAMCGLPGTAWRGANIAYRVNGDVDWISLGNFTTRAVMGNLTAPLAAASEFYTDTTNVLEVVLVGNDELETITQAQFLSEGNPAAVVYADGTAEVLQFRDVVDEGSRAWSLSRLLRGRLNTVPGPHLSAARFVMLAGSKFVPLPSALIGATLQFRVTSLGTSPEVAPIYDFVWNPVYSQREFPPAHLTLSRSGDVVSALAVPRLRFGTEDNPIGSVNWTGYRFTATDGTNTLTSDTGTATPRALFDVTGWASPVTVTAALTNRFTGPGPALSESIA